MLVAGNTFWGDCVLVEDFDSSMHTDGAQVNAEIGYGPTDWENLGLLTPYGGVFLYETQEDKYRMGNKLNLGAGIEFGLERSRILKDDGAMRTNSNLMVASSGRVGGVGFPVRRGCVFPLPVPGGCLNFGRSME